MARYGSLLGKRVEVHYRAGDITLPATARLVADSGRSIFLEEQYILRGRVQTFRWEIPYQCVMRLEETPAAPDPPPPGHSQNPAKAEDPGGTNLVPLREHPEKA